MENDKLKKFIEENRTQFDDLENLNLEKNWTGIVNSSKIPKNNQKMTIGLGLVILMLGVLIAYSVFQPEKKLSKIEQAFATEEVKLERDELLRLVSQKESKVLIKKEEHADLTMLYDELSKMDTMEKFVLKELDEMNDGEKITKVLMQYYQSKSRLLELILFEIEKKENYENVRTKEIY